MPVPLAKKHYPKFIDVDLPKATTMRADGTPKARGKQVSCPKHGEFLRYGVKIELIMAPELMAA